MREQSTPAPPSQSVAGAAPALPGAVSVPHSPHARNATGNVRQAGVLSLSLRAYKPATLANALIGCLRQGFAAWSRGGHRRGRHATAAAADADG